jgi:cyclomaltodextrinase / maltogenic alpha-amylase / neopullulanase
VVRKEVERIQPGVLLLAEASARDSYYMSHGFDAAYDWTGELGHWAWQGVFGPPGQLPNLRELRAALTNEGRGFPAGDAAGVVHFLNNNDTGERFIVAHGVTTTRLAAALLLTIPGIPLVYTGDEVGASFEPYAHPPPLGWSDPDHLLALYTRLIHLRREIPALRSPRLRLIHTSRDESVLAYMREADEPERNVTILLNFGKSSFDLPLSAIQDGKKPTLSWWAEDLLSGTRTVAPPDAESIRVASRGALLLRHPVPGNPRHEVCGELQAY